MAEHYNLYHTLELDRSASCEELSGIINGRLTELHDQNVPVGDARVQELLAALSILGDTNKRSVYDARLDTGSSTPALTIPDLQTLASTGVLPGYEDAGGSPDTGGSAAAAAGVGAPASAPSSPTAPGAGTAPAAPSAAAAPGYSPAYQQSFAQPRPQRRTPQWLVTLGLDTAPTAVRVQFFLWLANAVLVLLGVIFLFFLLPKGASSSYGGSSLGYSYTTLEDMVFYCSGILLPAIAAPIAVTSILTALLLVRHRAPWVPVGTGLVAGSFALCSLVTLWSVIGMNLGTGAVLLQLLVFALFIAILITLSLAPVRAWYRGEDAPGLAPGVTPAA